VEEPLEVPLEEPLEVPALEEPAATMPPINYKLLGKGSYGAVIHPALPDDDEEKANAYSSRKYVSKIMPEKEFYNKTLKNYKRVANVMNNEVYQAHPQNIRSVGTLPPMVQRLPEFRSLHEAHVVRLPYLGVSIEDLVHPESNGPNVLLQQFRHTPFHLFMAQLYKCHRQLARLQEHHMIHGDIRLPNVLWNPETAGLHIIDFDMLNTYPAFDENNREFYGFYSYPPETLVVEPQKLDTWVATNWLVYQPLMTALGNVSQEGLWHQIMGSIDVNQRILSGQRTHLYEAVKRRSFPSFDSYGFGMVMGTLLVHAYVGSMSRPEETLPDNLRTRLRDGDKEYSNMYLQVIARVLANLNVLYRRCVAFPLNHRIDAVTAFQTMAYIYDWFLNEHNHLRPDEPLPPRSDATGKNPRRGGAPRRSKSLKTRSARSKSLKNRK